MLILPLHVAVRKDELGIATLLIEHGADLNKVNRVDDTPLFIALPGRKEIVKLLIVKGADVNQVNNSDDTPLYWVARYGEEWALKLLIAKGADINPEEDQAHITNDAIKKLLKVKEYADSLLKPGVTENIELNQEQHEMILARIVHKIKSQFELPEVIVDLNKVTEMLDSKVALHPVLTKVIEAIQEFKAEECSSRDAAAAHIVYNVTSVYPINELYSSLNIQNKNKAKYQVILKAFKNKKAEEGFNSEKLDELKEVFTAYLSNKQQVQVAENPDNNNNGIKEYDEFAISARDQASIIDLFKQFVEITGIREDAGVQELLTYNNDIQALKIEEALLFFSLNPIFQIPGIVTQEWNATKRVQEEAAKLAKAELEQAKLQLEGNPTEKAADQDHSIEPALIQNIELAGETSDHS